MKSVDRVVMKRFHDLSLAWEFYRLDFNREVGHRKIAMGCSAKGNLPQRILLFSDLWRIHVCNR